MYTDVDNLLTFYMLLIDNGVKKFPYPLHRCKTYTSLPSVCKMYDVPGECCAEVRCKNVETSPTPPVIGGPTVRPYLDPLCHDTIDNCKSYQKEVACRGVYEPWARTHCNLTCGFCRK